MDEAVKTALDALTSELSGEIYGVWFLIGAALVFWMQAGFAMVEAGFTRAKNTGNIIMKNLMDFCIGTVMFVIIGYGLLLGNDLGGFMGKPNWNIFSNYAEFNFSAFVFNLVFCATTATIVSGAMAERTKFLSYCVYSAVLSAVVYPIEAHWTWGGGWLAEMGFHDFAGSNCIHMVGGIAALIGAAILGPRIGKFKKRKDGSIKVGAFPGHNLALGALGVFILWLGWYGFNGAAATSLNQLGSIFLTTTIAPAVATVVCMIFTWIKYGKPDVSMCLNASLAGLVAITAPCDVTDVAGATIIGAVAGLLVVFGVWFLDYKLRIDDPVGAVAVHMLNGIWGTLAVGLFATTSAPGYALADSSGKVMKGLFYGGGFKLLGIQMIGMLATAAWTAIVIGIVFFAIKKIFGLRVTPEEEIQGLDATEHGIASAYADFMPTSTPVEILTSSSEGVDMSGVSHKQIVQAAGSPESKVSKDVAVPVEVRDGGSSIASDVKLSRISIICKQSKFEDLKDALNEIGVTGLTVTQVLGCGAQKGNAKYYRGVQMDVILLPKVKVEVVVCEIPVRKVIDVAKRVLYTGNIGDGKIFVYDVENVIKVRTGEEGAEAVIHTEDGE